MIKPKIRVLDLHNIPKYLYRSHGLQSYTFSYFRGGIMRYDIGTTVYHTIIDKYLKHLSKTVLK